MKLLVTGGCGFIGANFVRHWLEKHPGDSITDLDLLTYAAAPENLKDLDGRGHMLVKGDIADRELVDRLVKDADAVINFAAETHVDNSIAASERFVHSNVVGVHVMLEAIRKHGKRFHQVSTDEVFGSLPLDSDKRFDENTHYAPKNPYSATKAAADHLVRAYFNTYKLPVTISNCGNNFGRYQNAEKFIPKAILNALNGVRIPVYGKGANVRDWIYVEDHCSALEQILLRGRPGETYMIGTGYEKHNIDVAKEILRRLGKPESLIQLVDDRPGHDLRYATDATRLKKELGWKADYTFEQGLDKTIEWYSAQNGRTR